MSQAIGISHRRNTWYLGRKQFDHCKQRRFFLSTATSQQEPRVLGHGHPQLSSTGFLHTHYHKLVEQRNVQVDPHQLRALESLERLRDQLLAKTPKELEPPPMAAVARSTNSFFGGWISAAQDTVQESMQPSIKGAYLHGGVGCGKTFLMNLFYDSITEGPWAASKQKVHFHAFMLNVHSQMHQARYKQKDQPNHDSDAIIPMVIHNILEQGHLICFDEFQVTDVADALILQRLFQGIWKGGGVVVATSNRAPKDLYLNGIQRDRFLPFIGLLERKCQVVDMWESETDYRLVQKKPDHGTVFFVGKDGRKAMDELFYDLVGQAAVAPTALQTQGRRVNVPQAATSKGIARFTFKDLCQKALGAADYLVIGEHYHTVFVELVPTLTMNELNWVRRFIVFVDSMYECHVKLVLHAHNDMLDIFQRPQDDTDHDEVFAFDRTLSRLEEMSSETYLKKRWGGKTEKTKMATKQDDVRSSSKIEVQPVQEADYDQQRFQTDRSLR